MKKIDEKISKRLFDWGQPAFSFWSIISRFGLWLMLVPGILLREGSMFWVPTLVVVSITLLLVVVLQEIFRRPRPSFGSNYKQLALKWSFPSGHSAVAFAIAFLSLSWGIAPEIVFVYFLAVLVSLSRVFVGVHYLLDVIFGALLGTAVSATVYIVIVFYL